MRSYFEDIEMNITAELMKAQSSINVAVAWFTNKRLLDILLFKQKNGIKVSVLVHDDKINRTLDFSILQKLGGYVAFVSFNKSLMHLKFCIIDSNILILGCYNWTWKAENVNHEQISIIEGDNAEILKFQNKFDEIKCINIGTQDKPDKIYNTKEQWINTPYSFAELNTDLPLLAQQIMWCISEKIQNYIRQFYDADICNKQVGKKPLWANSKDIPKITIDFNSLNIHPSHFNDIDKTIKAIEEIKIKTVNYNGGIITNWLPIFANVEIPKQYVSSGERMRRQGTIVFTFNADCIENVFDMRKGYIHHMKDVVKLCQKKHTPQLYLLLKRLQGLKTNYITYEELKAFMFKTDSYKKWSHFSQKVLEKTKEDFSSLAQKGAIDILFDYEPIFRNPSKPKGNPEKIKFHIRKV